MGLLTMGYIYKLMFKADLIKCTNMQMNDGFNDPFTEYKFKLTCLRCGVEVDANVSLATEVPYQHLNDDEEADEDEDEEMSLEEHKILANLQVAAENVPVQFNDKCACCGKHLCIKIIPIENGIGLTDSPNDSTTLIKFFIQGAIPSKYQPDKNSWQVTRLVDETLHAFSLECDQEEEDDEAYMSYSYSSGDAFSSFYLEIANAKFYFTREA